MRVLSYARTYSVPFYNSPAESFRIDVDDDVDVENLRVQANASMPASYIANYIC